MSAAAGDGQVEIERKYDVGDTTRMPDLTGLKAADVVVASVSDPVEHRLDALYLDSDDLALATRRTALRRRSGGRDAGWHLKTPGDEGRTERQWPLTEGGGSGSGTRGEAAPRGSSASETAVPGAVADAVAELIGRRVALSPVARIVNRRVAVDLLDDRGSVVAEAVDDHVDADDLRGGVTRSWREWEVELGPAAPGDRASRTALLDAVDARFAEVGVRISRSSSKLARALGRDRD